MKNIELSAVSALTKEEKTLTARKRKTHSVARDVVDAFISAKEIKEPKITIISTAEHPLTLPQIRNIASGANRELKNRGIALKVSVRQKSETEYLLIASVPTKE